MSKKVLTVVVVVAVVALASATPNGTIKPVSFPSTQSKAVSPNGLFAVINIDSDEAPYHTLFLENRRTKVRRKISEYERHVEVLWSPDSTKFAVTDYAGSNVAECAVLSTNESLSSQNVADALQNRIKNAKERADLASGGHIYWKAVRWKSSNVLIVKVFGHTDENPSHEFEYFHAYRTGVP